MAGKYSFSIDRGGTFTDVLCICPGNKVRTMKLLSVDPLNYEDAPTESIRRILQEETGNALTAEGLIDTSLISWIRMGTTVATNALLERRGEPLVLVINSGYRDLLYIGNQSRPKIFELNIKKPSNLYEYVVEVDCRVVPAMDERCLLDTKSWRKVVGVAGKEFLIQKELDEAEVIEKLQAVYDQGIRSVAVALIHSYAYAEHELKIGEIAKKLGFTYITLSHQSMPMQRIVNRGFTAVAEAYLTPHVERYLENFKRGFHNNLNDVEVLFMQSDGGLTRMNTFRGARAILSGPAGGVVGYAETGTRDTNLPLIGFDMGGTSTDVSRFDGKYEHVVESTTAGATIQCPQLDINTVAAGGGSRLFFRSGLFVVGPESANSHPGPTCYKKNGPLTVTDANLVLGRLFPEFFPKIFGPHENEPLDVEASTKNFEKLTSQINKYFLANDLKKEPMTIQQVAMGFIRVANEAMCRPIRALTQSRGFDTSKHALAVFGGAGGQHACSIAKDLGMETVLIHKYAGILSAYGMALADVVFEDQEPSGLELVSSNLKMIQSRLDAISENCRNNLMRQGFPSDRIILEPYLHLRYEGTDCALMVSPDVSDKNRDYWIENYGNFFQSFINRYKKEFGFVLKIRKIIVDDIRVRGYGKNNTPEELNAEQASYAILEPEKYGLVYFNDRFVKTKIFLTEKLKAGHKIDGPAVLIDKLSTTLIEPDCTGTVTSKGDLIIKICNKNEAVVNDKLDSIQLSIFSHRFMSIAEQMGRVLQRTSISTNIKERLDFSCALFGPDGGLVSNAPHIPVHLGAMQETVQYQIKARGSTIKPGDVLLSNHPQAGGSHLPDLTVITPVFYPNIKDPVFFVASRGHHADIGGITPGSMPPHSKTLADEGAAFKSFLLVDGGTFNEAELVTRLTTPTQALGAKGTRNLDDNISDLKAQIAANQKGIQLVSELINYYGLNVVQAYMNYMQKNAEECVRDMLKEIALETFKRTGDSELYAEEKMDDGTKICLRVNIDREMGSAIFDFSGTGFEVYGNCNAPRAITLSAIIYTLRCMVGYDIPLNQGCLIPIKIIIPEGSILNPSEDSAVVGGNVLTSQRIVDTILKAFNVCAASQGCMNNITVGDETWGYYETVGGGSGATAVANGVGGVHTHMTNTRITDPEILEARYPIILQKFMLRTDQSGGLGKFVGGEGVQRDLLFRRPLTLSVLTERRVLEPYGLNGGLPGKVGLNLLKKQDGHVINLGGKAAVKVNSGDTFSMLTPGGGGFGAVQEGHSSQDIQFHQKSDEIVEKGSLFQYRMLQESA